MFHASVHVTCCTGFAWSARAHRSTRPQTANRRTRKTRGDLKRDVTFFSVYCVALMTGICR